MNPYSIIDNLPFQISHEILPVGSDQSVIYTLHGDNITLDENGLITDIDIGGTLNGMYILVVSEVYGIPAVLEIVSY